MCFISWAHAAATRCVMRWQPRLAGGKVICIWAHRGVVTAIAAPIRVALCSTGCATSACRCTAARPHATPRSLRRCGALYREGSGKRCALALAAVHHRLAGHDSDGGGAAVACCFAFAFALRFSFVCGNLQRRLKAQHRAGRAGGARSSRTQPSSPMPDLLHAAFSWRSLTLPAGRSRRAQIPRDGHANRALRRRGRTRRCGAKRCRAPSSGVLCGALFSERHAEALSRVLAGVTCPVSIT